MPQHPPSTTTLPSQVAEFIHHHHMIPASTPTPRIGIAVSAGADSVVLLHILHQLRSQFPCDLHVLHLNHQLRGAASDSDESFVRTLAASLGLPVTVERTTPPSTQIEQQARNLRRSFFQRAMQEHRLNAVALGHTRSDQAETVLFRLLRGTGATGLAAMRPVTADHLIRPLLTCSRDEIRAWAVSQNISWRDDASNLDTTFTRNRIRLETLPALAATYNPNLQATLAHSADLAQTEENYFAAEIEKLYPPLVVNTRLGLQMQVPKLTALHLALQRRLVRRAIFQLLGHLHAIDFHHIESILHLCQTEEGHNRVIIPGIDALRSFDQLLLSQHGLRSTQERDYQIDIQLGQEYELPFQTGFLSIDRLNPEEPPPVCANFKEGLEQKFQICDWDGDLLCPAGTLSPLCVRNWRPGDVFQRAGHHSEEKIKSLFQSGKVLLWERKHWPVVLAGNKIVWVRQFGASASVTSSSKEGSSNRFRLIYRQS